MARYDVTIDFVVNIGIVILFSVAVGVLGPEMGPCPTVARGTPRDRLVAKDERYPPRGCCQSVARESISALRVRQVDGEDLPELETSFS